jgi:hypothetical protein
MLETRKRATARLPSRDHRRRSRRAGIEVAPLENRALLSTTATSPITITETVTTPATPTPFGRPIPVQVAGTVTDSDAPPATLDKTLAYTVVNTQTNREIRTGTAAIQPDGSYMFTVDFPGRRFGRHHFQGFAITSDFTITVMASDSAGNTGSDSSSVLITPSQGPDGGNPFFSGNGQFSRRFGSGSGGAGNLAFGGPGQGQSNSVSVPGNNNTVTQNVTNNQSNTYNITNNVTNTTTTTTTTTINSPPQPPHHPGPPAPHPGPPAPDDHDDDDHGPGMNNDDGGPGDIDVDNPPSPGPPHGPGPGPGKPGH